VHLANLPENLAFYSGRIDDAGSFGGHLSIGRAVLRQRPDPESAERGAFVAVRHLQTMEKSG
jgi:NitT/TauT family transport system substrate-binding protein